MHAVQFHESGPSDVLTVEDVPRPDPAPDEVLVEVFGAGINPVDAKRRASWDGPLPKTTGSDFAGEVVERGEGVTAFDVGDRVFGTGFYHPRFRGGPCATYLAAPIDTIAALPDGVDADVGATIGVVGVTAWEALVERADLQPGASCLIHGGSGGVGHVAVQLASIMGAHTVATAGSEAGLELVGDYGADVALDYASETLAADVIDATDGGPDVILQPRLEHYFQFDADVAADWADVVVIDGDGRLERGEVARHKNLTHHHLSMSHLLVDPDTPPISRRLAELARLMERDGLHTNVARRYPLEATADAHRDVMAESINGKILIEVASS